MLEIVRLATQRGKPSDAEMTNLAAPLASAMAAAQNKACGPRCESMNHDKAVYECLQGLTWVTYDAVAAGAEHH